LSSSSPSSSFVAPGEVVSTLTLSSTRDLRDFNQPHAEGALVKCALLLLGVVRLRGAGDEDGPDDLRAQLAAALGGADAGLEVETWSLVPHGSGLGTSSILAAAVLAALAGAAGAQYERAALCHMVLKLEQMLTTGGGWQDQVGGLWPGANASACGARLPVAVRVLPLSASPAAAGELAAFLGRHLFLVYTGQTRLAKNLLQRVLRQWAMRENSITQTVAELRANAVAMAAALRARDAAGVGAALSAYWEQKKRMAPMAEPPAVTLMLAALRPLLHGASLCGAGGGGFLVGVAREPGEGMLARVRAALRGADAEIGGGWEVIAAGVDDVGLALQIVEG
jgi:fucokinase